MRLGRDPPPYNPPDCRQVHLILLCVDMLWVRNMVFAVCLHAGMVSQQQLLAGQQLVIQLCSRAHARSALQSCMYAAPSASAACSCTSIKGPGAIVQLVHTGM